MTKDEIDKVIDKISECFGPPIIRVAPSWNVSLNLGILLSCSYTDYIALTNQNDYKCCLWFYDWRLYPHYTKYAQGNKITLENFLSQVNEKQQEFILFNLDIFRHGFKK